MRIHKSVPSGQDLCKDIMKVYFESPVKWEQTGFRAILLWVLKFRWRLSGGRLSGTQYQEFHDVQIWTYACVQYAL
jgi:hypothetical protein